MWRLSFLFLLIVSAITLAEQCRRPFIPPRMIMTMPSLSAEKENGVEFEPGTVAMFRCHSDYLIREVEPIVTICQENGTWSAHSPWDNQHPYFCGNEINNLELVNKKSSRLLQKNTKEVHSLPLKNCLKTGRRSVFTITFPSPTDLLFFSIKTRKDSRNVNVIYSKTNGSFSCLEDVRGGEDAFISCPSNDVNKVTIRVKGDLCSLRFFGLDKAKPSHCKAELAGSMEGGRISQIVKGKPLYSCDGAERIGLLEATCDEKGRWTGGGHCNRIYP